MQDDIVALFAYDRWANRKVLDACRTLTAEQYVAEPVPGWSSVRSTISHIALATEFNLRTLASDPDDRIPTEADLAFARNAASDVLTKGSKDFSQPWENPKTGARGSVTPIAAAYTSDGRTCRDFLASYVNGRSESWLQGGACKSAQGQWEIHTLKPWKNG